MRKRFSSRPRCRFPGNVFIILFGALPATYFCSYAFLVLKAAVSVEYPGKLVSLAFVFGGLCGTISLWRISFRQRSKYDRVGLTCGVISMIPVLMVQYGERLGPIAASPVIVALIWLLVDSSRRRRRASSTMTFSRRL